MNALSNPGGGSGAKPKGALYRETLQTTGFYMGRVVIVPREFAPISSPPLRARGFRETDPEMRFLRHGRIYRSDRDHPSNRPGRDTASRWSAPRPAKRRDGRSAPYPSSAMSSGRLFLDRVARQQSPSPLHRQVEHNMYLTEARHKGDISTLLGRGHFYFALT